MRHPGESKEMGVMDASKLGAFRISAGTAVAAVISAAAFVAVLASPAAALACPTPGHSDINGDGHADAVVGEPGRDNFAGGIHVLYGKDGGLTADASGTALNDQLLTQNSPGVPGTSETDDIFGFAVAVADFNGDGCGDVAVGVPGEDQAAGTVVVLYGSTSGVVT